MRRVLLLALLITVTVLAAATVPLLNPTTSTRNPTPTPPQTQWSRTYGGTGSEIAFSVRQTTDGGYVIAGHTNSFGAGTYDVWLVKIDANGNEQWDKTYGGTGVDDASSIQQTSDGGYVVAGFTSSFGAGMDDFWLLKIDSVGRQEWSKTYGGNRSDDARSVLQTADGGYIIVGSSYSFCDYGADFWFSDLWLVKTDSEGNMQWNKTYGGTKSDYGGSVLLTLDGGYIILGQTFSYGSRGGGDFWLVKTDGSGNMQWNKTYGTGAAYPSSVEQTSNGGYIAAGFTASPSLRDFDLWLVKTDSEGNMQWNKTYGGIEDDSASSVEETSDGGYIAAGYTNSSGAGGGDLWLVKTDLAGNQQWNRTFGGTDTDVAYSVQQSSDGGYIAAGYTSSFGAGGFDIWLVKVHSEGGVQSQNDLIVLTGLGGVMTAVAVVSLVQRRRGRIA